MLICNKNTENPPAIIRIIKNREDNCLLMTQGCALPLLHDGNSCDPGFKIACDLTNTHKKDEQSDDEWENTCTTHSLDVVVLACSDSARLLITGGFEAAAAAAAATQPLALATTSPGAAVLVVATVLQRRGFTVLWLLTGSALLLGCSSGLVPGAADA